MRQQETGSQHLIFYSVKMHLGVLTQRAGVLCVIPSPVCCVAEVRLESESNHTCKHVLLSALLYVSENNYVSKMSHKAVCFCYMLSPLFSLLLYFCSFYSSCVLNIFPPHSPTCLIFPTAYSCPVAVPGLLPLLIKFLFTNA